VYDRRHAQNKDEQKTSIVDADLNRTYVANQS